MNENPGQQQSLPQDQPNTEESIFNEEELIDDRYMKNVRRARNTIFWVAGIEFVLGSIGALMGSQEEVWLNFGLSAVIALIFLGIGFWADKNPYPAILTALILYLVLNVLSIAGSLMSSDPGILAFRGIIVKVIIIIYLIKGLNNAAEARRIKNALGPR